MATMTLLGDSITGETELCDRIKSEFREMPGLSLTMLQAARLWHVDLATCASALLTLEGAGLLRRVGERYLRAQQ